MGLKRTSYKDDSGKFRMVLLPEEANEEEAPNGIPLGPPNLEALGLPEEMETRLSNELFHRGIITEDDASRRRNEIVSAIMVTFRVDAERIASLYSGE